MPIDALSLLAPVAPDQPAGDEARDTDPYEAVAAEIEKLSSMSGSGPVDWARVEEQARVVLTAHSKDFLIASWLCAAWTHRHGIDGLTAGMQLQAGLATQYWDTGFPALKRLRGRRNALVWWLERATQWLEDAQFDPLPAEHHAALVDAVSTLDREWAEKDPESPPLGTLLRQVERLDVQAAAAPAPADPAPSDPAPDHHPAPAAQASVAPQTSAPAAATSRPNELAPAGELASLDDVEQALAPACHYLSQIGTALLDIDPTHPLTIEINRCAARLPLLSLPPATGAATALPAPPSPIIDAFESIMAAGNADGLIAFCESRIAAFPYWLDLDREAARGFSLLGTRGAAARREVIRHALAFTSRLPGLEDLCFADGTPFASEATRQWLAQCRAEQGGTAPVDRYDQVGQEAAAAVAAGRLDDATQCYQTLIRTTWSGRDRFRAQLALIELLMGTRADADVQPLLAPLLADADARDLATWEPELATHAWQLAARAARQALAAATDADPATRQALTNSLHTALGRLSSLDFAQAARLA